MTLVSPTQSNPGDELTDTLLNTPHNQIADVLNGNIDDTNISAISGTKISSGTLPGSAMTTDSNPETRFDEAIPDFIASGCVWSATTGLGGAMTSGVVYIGGKRVVVSSVSSHTFTASKDTYVSVDNTGTISYSETTNGGAQPSLPSNSIWLYKIVTGGSTVSTVTSIGARGLDGGFGSWVPTFANLSGGTLNYAVYMQVGKRVDFKLKYTLGGAGVSGAVTFTVPVPMASRTAATTDVFNVNVELDDNNGNAYLAGAAWTDANTLKIFAISASGSYAQYVNISSTVPFTWASSDYILVNGSYEAA